MMDELLEAKDLDKYVLSRYRDQINYYWSASGRNKRNFRYYRILPIFLGAFLTFASAISSTDYIASNQPIRTIFAIGTPLLAVLLTISNELFKITSWSENWRDGVLTAQRLEKERDCYLALDRDKRNPQKELEKIYKITIRETRSFFKRTTSESEDLNKDSGDPNVV